MLEFAARLFDATDFTPRANCGPGWTPALVWLHVAGDLFIWLAYVSIPLVLLYLVRRHEVPFSRLFVLFALFILACGFGHFLEALMFEYPLYRLAGVWKAVTAAVSWATVVALVVVSPRVMAAVGAFHGGPAPPAPGPADTVPSDRARVNDYTVGVLAGVLALLVRAAIDPLVNTDHFYALSLLAVVFVSWQSGFGPAVVTLLLSMAGMVYFFIPPTRSFVVADFSNQLATAVFFFCGVCCAALGEAQRQARKATKGALVVALGQKDSLAAEVGRRQAAEGELREANRRVGAILDSITDAAFGLDPEFRYTYANRHWETMFGRRAAEVVGRPIWDVVPGLLGTTVEAGYRRAMRDRVPVAVEHVHPATGRWVEFRAYPAPEGGLGVYLRDIEDRKAAERERRQLLSLVEASTDLIGLADLDGRVTYFNDAGLRLLGLDSLEQARTKTLFDFVVPDDLAALRAEMMPALERDGRWEGEWRYREAKTGQPVPVSKKVVLIRDPDTGAATAYATVSRDIAARLRAEAAVRESEARFRTLADSAPALIWVGGPDGARTYFNRTWLEFTGRVLGEETGDGWVGAVHPDDRDRYLREYRGGVAGRRPFEIEYRLRRHDGAYRWVLARGVPRFAPDGAFLGLVGLCLDVTDRREAEAAVRESEERLRLAVDIAQMGTFEIDLTTDAVTVNEQGRDIYGWADTRTTFTAVQGHFHPDDKAEVMRRVEAAFDPAGPGTFEVEQRIVRADGGVRWVRVRGRALFDGGRAVRCLGSYLDVTDQRRAAESLRESEARFRTLAEAVPQIVWVTRPDGYHEYYNPKWYEYTGMSEEESIGFGWSTPLHPDDKARSEARWKQSTETGEEYDVEYRFRGRDGQYRWFLGRALPQRDAAGTIVRWFGTCTDIHDAKQAEADLRASEERFRQLADSMPQIVFAARPDGHVDYFNRRWYEYTGFPDDGRTGDESWAGVHEPEALARVAEVWGRSLRTGEPYQIEYRLRRADGALRWHLGRALPVRDASGSIIRWYGTNTDIHDAKLAAEALRASEERYRTLTEAIPQIVWNTDPDGEATYFNRRWVDYTGLSADESRGRGWLAAVHPDDRDRVYAAWRETVDPAATGTADRFTVEVRVRHRDGGEYRWFLTVAVPLRRPDGGIDQWIGSMADIHDQKAAAGLVEEANHFLEATINALPSHIAVLDRDGSILKVNDAWRRFGDQNGLRLDEHGVGSNYLDACDVACSTDPELRLSEGIREVIDGGRETYRTEYPCHSPKDRRWFQMRVTRFPGGGPVRVVVAHENITDRVLAELAVRESEEKFRTLAESIPQLAWMTDADGYIFWYNQRWYDYTGTTFDEMKGWGWESVHDPAELPRVVEKFKAHLASGEPWEDTFPLRRHDGEMRWHLSRARPIRDEGGKVVRWFGTNTDITERRQMEQALRGAAERFRTLTEAVPQMVWTADAAGEVTFFNRRWDEYTGVPLAPGRADGWGALVHPDDAEALRTGWRDAVARRADLFTREFRLRRTDGVYRWMLSTAVPLRDAAGGVAEWVGSITDLDDQKRYSENLERTVRERTAALVAEVEERTRAEAEVRKQREFLDAILANVADGIVACDETGSLTLFNRAALEFHGLPPEPLPPEQWAGRYDLYRADGVTPLPKAEIPLFRALRGERVRDAEMVIAPRGRPHRFLVANGQRLADADGRNLGAVVSMRDVTDQREADRQLADAAAELRRTNAELARSNGELEQFAYVASHDLQEPLRKIQAFGDRLTTKFRDQLPDVGRDYVDRMLVSSGRMRRLIDDLLTFSRVTTQARPFVPLDLGKLVREVIGDVSDRLEQAGGEVRVGDLPAIDADPTQMRQLFQNLIVNAIKFHRPGVPPVVEVSGEVLAEPGPGGEPGRTCRITVRDNGIGFDEKYLDRIFQVFQRLHGREEYEGTGVGLAICRKITDRHGGTITAHSRPGEGATFIVTLPVRHPNPPDA